MAVQTDGNYIIENLDGMTKEKVTGVGMNLQLLLDVFTVIVLVTKW